MAWVCTTSTSTPYAECPNGTLVVNISGATILGLLTAVALPTSTALIAGTGSSAYTTFSTWMLETHRLSEQRQHRHAITNVAASIALGLAAAATGRALGAQHL